MPTIRHLLLLLLPLVLIPHVASQTYTRGEWTLAFRATAMPHPRLGGGGWPWGANATAAYDETRGVVVLFGGGDFSNLNLLAETWEWDGTIWAQKNPAVSPPARLGRAMAYDARRGVTVLFGGVIDPLGSQFQYFDDTWEWDGTNWIRRDPPASPSARSRAGMVYDARRGVTVLLGGFGPNGDLRDTWEWDGRSWIPRGSPVQPTISAANRLVFNPQRGVVALPDPGRLGVWEWDGREWTFGGRVRLSAGGMTDGVAAFDTQVGRIVTFRLGRTGQVDDLYWVESSLTPNPGGPLRLLAFDQRRNVSVLAVHQFSGSFETWVYRATTSGSYTRFGAACAGTAGLPELGPGQVPALGQPFSTRLTNLPPARPGYMYLALARDLLFGFRLPFDLASLGAPGCTMDTSADLVFGVVSGAAGTLDWGFPMPAEVYLEGLNFYNQALFFDPGANPAGVITTNAGHGVIGN